MFEDLKKHIEKLASNPEFIHHKWFVKYHLEVVERIALEACDIYPAADKELVRLMAWMHDYGKMIDFAHQYEATLEHGGAALTKIGFAQGLVDRTMRMIEIMDKKLEIDLKDAPIEVQIVASADGASHFVGPFFYLWWYENPNKSFEELMQDNVRKIEKDWKRKIVIPEIGKAFEGRYFFLREQSAFELPAKFFS